MPNLSSHLLPTERVQSAILIEIASYPRSGNAWMRSLLGRFFRIPDPLNAIPDVHKFSGDYETQLAERMAASAHTPSFKFYKTHWLHTPKMQPDRNLHIFRHPLDVFLSCLNFFYVTKNFDRIYPDGLRKSVDDLIQSGEINYLFDQFVDELGAGYFRFLGAESCYENYVCSALSDPSVLSVCFEDIQHNPIKVLQGLVDDLAPKIGVTVTQSDIDFVDQQTKFKPKTTYWKASSGGFKKLLRRDQIEKFYNRHGQLLQKLGYSEQ